MTDTREQFERVFDLSSRQAWRTKDGNGYKDENIQAKWEGWQAREKIAEPMPPARKRINVEADFYPNDAE